MSIFIGIDTGGTFTDFIVVEQDSLRVHKVLSTPHAPEQAILQGLQDLGVGLEASQIVHGSTVATNAVLEGKGVMTAYICNTGLADVLSIGRQTRKHLYRLQAQAAPVPVPAKWCIETGGRLNAQGQLVQELTQEHLEDIGKKLTALQPQAVAINLLFSFLDDQYEKQIEAVVPKHIFVSRSSKVLPEYREYERGIATWLNAWVGPLMRDYLHKLEQQVQPASLSIMQSSANTVSAKQAAELAVNLLLSGPAGGLRGAQYSAALNQHQRLMTFDMGGTSTDVALIDGAIQLSSQGSIGDYPVAVPMVNMHTIGAGGGSIAYQDQGGLLQVGPESAGASPGPACYGQGGSRPTVTDANLVLGRIPKDGFLAGKLPLNETLARQAVGSLAEALCLAVEETAQGIIDVANEHMSNALKVISVAKGFDPKEFCLVSFGGAGGLHVCALADSLGMQQALVPNHAGVLSAVGMVVAPKGRQLSRTYLEPLCQASNAQIQGQLENLAKEGRQALELEGVSADSIDVNFSLDVRYQGQTETLNVPWKDTKTCETQFHHLHNKRFGHTMDLTVECVNLRAGLQAPGGHVPLQGADSIKPSSQAENVVARQDVGSDREGPCIIMDAFSTTYLPANWRASLLLGGNLQLKRI